LRLDWFLSAISGLQHCFLPSMSKPLAKCWKLLYAIAPARRS